MSQQKESTNCYMDGIRVKISEKYKPPPKITLAMTYAQRLSLNRQLQDNLNLPNSKYNFDMTAMNVCVKEKMKEWRTIRSNVISQRKLKLELELKAQNELKEQQEKLEQNNIQDDTINVVKENFDGQRSNVTNCLTPVQMVTPQKFCPVVKTLDDASPINISDFEPDTSSPFDNLELKSINDLEELKLVLQNETKFQSKNQNFNPNEVKSQHFDVTTKNYEVNTQNYDQGQSQGQYFSTNSTTSTTNDVYGGFYGNYVYYNGTRSANDDYGVYNKQNQVEITRNVNVINNTQSDDGKVPDILKVLQNQLNLNLNINHDMNCVSTNTSFEDTSFGSKDLRDNHVKFDENQLDLKVKSSPIGNKAESVDKLENPFCNLSKSSQNICESIASMGFDLARVSRVCKTMGDDEKKIVEFLLCQSQLMDLGFSEEKVTSALMDSDNNRDKALELLIS